MMTMIMIIWYTVCYTYNTYKGMMDDDDNDADDRDIIYVIHVIWVSGVGAAS